MQARFARFAGSAGEKNAAAQGTETQPERRSEQQRSGRTAPVVAPIRHHGQYDIVKVFLELEHELDAGDFVDDAEVNGLGGTDKIHRPGWLTRPVANILYV